MTSIKLIPRLASFAAVLALAATSANAAQSNVSQLRMKPLQGISFDIGGEHAVAYFLPDQSTCKLVVTHAAEPDLSDENATFSATRFEVTVAAQKTAIYRAPRGNSLEFFCESGASAMSIAGIEVVATAPLR